MIETVEYPGFTTSDFDSRNKRPGLSAIVTLKNEEEFAEASLNSILPYFDEIVIVFNDCTDGTPEIVAEFEQQNPERVRAFEYVPKVFPRGSRQHQYESPRSVHSIVHYFNFALSKVTCQVCCKWDGDQIAEPKSFGQVVRQIRSLERGTLAWWLSPWQWGAWWYTGVNLWDDRGQIFIRKARPLIGNSHDHRFWPAQRWIVYKRYSQSAYLFTRLLKHTFVGCLFFHLKSMKRDRGAGNFLFDKNPDSLVREMFERNLVNPALITFDELRRIDPRVQHLPNPTELGIRPISAR